jgi:Ca2+-binding RTX toxin-like protein
VTTLLDHVPGSLRDAIASTPSGGTVDFQPGLTGTIVLSGSALSITKDLTVAGPGANVIMISGGHITQVFSIGSGTVTLSGLTVANGYSKAAGGGISNSGTLSIAGSTVSGNSAGGEGGGLVNYGTLTVTDSTVNGNSAGSGGGIANDNGTVTVTDSTVSGNSTNSEGGGLWNTGGTMIVNDSTLSGNSTQYAGGGIQIGGGTLALTGSTLIGNHSQFNGGGITLGWATSGDIFNTIVAENTAPYAPDVNAGPVPGSVLTTLGHNLIGDGSGSWAGSATDLIGTAAHPLDPKLGPLQYNGGPTATMAPLPGSPALGAGDPTNAPAYDQRGQGYARLVSGALDMGAIQVQGPSAVVTGTPAADQIIFSPGPTSGDLMVSVNGVVQGTMHPGRVQIHDRGGHDTITLNGTANSDDFVVGTGTITFNGIAISADSPVQWVLDGQAGNNLLEGPNTPGNQWYITATDAGSLGPVHFTNVGNLVGSASWDIFRLSDGVGVSGRLDGGGGGNTLDYAAYTTGVIVNMTAGLATNIAGGITNIQSATGGSGSDLLIGNDQDNVLIGGNGGNDTLIGGGGHDFLVGCDGNDLLIGGPNRSVLIGGTGHDTLQAGNGADILIAGTTPWDSQVDTAALVAIRNEWIRLDEKFAQRMSNLRGLTSGGQNGSYDLNGTTVTEDGAADTLTGGAGHNWFWADLAHDTITNLKGGDQVN